MKMQSKYFFVPSPPCQVWRKCSSTEQPVSWSTSAKPWQFKVKKNWKKKKKSRIKKDVEKETVVPWDFQGLGTAFLQMVRTWTIVETKSRQRQRGQVGSWWCGVRMSVVRGLEEKATWFWWLYHWVDFAELYLPLKQHPSPWEENAHGCSPGGLGAKNLPANQKTWVWSLCWEDSPGEEMETQSSTLDWGNPTDRGTWRTAVHGVTKSWTQLSNWAWVDWDQS